MFSGITQRLNFAFNSIGKRLRQMDEDEQNEFELEEAERRGALIALRRNNERRRLSDDDESAATPTQPASVPRFSAGHNRSSFHQGALSDWERNIRFDVKRKDDAALLSPRELALSSISGTTTQPSSGRNSDPERLARTQTLALWEEEAGLPGIDAAREATTHIEPTDYDALLAEVSPIYIPLLQAVVKEEVTREVTGQLTQLERSWKDVVSDCIRYVVLSVVPQHKGALKAIRTQTPLAIPFSLDADDQAKLMELRNAPSSANVINNTKLTYEITGENMRSCFGKQWLYDSVINYYCALIQEQFPGVITLGSFLFTMISGPGGTQQAARWTKQKDIFSPKKVLIVINQHKHWTLAVLNNEKGRLEYFDSMGGNGSAVLDKIAVFLDEEYERKKQAIADRASDRFNSMSARDRKNIELKTETPALPKVLPSRMPRFTPEKQVPQQANGYDCGVFTCQFCLYTALDLPFHRIGQSDMPFLRDLIALELISGRIIPRI